MIQMPSTSRLINRSAYRNLPTGCNHIRQTWTQIFQTNRIF